MTREQSIRQTTSKIVAVHDGTAHWDDALSVAILNKLFNVKIVRTREPQTLADADFRADVGGKHNPATGDFDHHQPDVPRRANGVKYAAAGLLWLEYGSRICGGADVANLVDDTLIQHGDAADNGETPWKHVRDPIPYTVACMLETFNPTWLEQGLTEDHAFHQMVRVAELILDRNIAQAKTVVAARGLIREAAAVREDPRIMVLGRKLPWQNAVADEFPEVRYVIYDDGNYWSVRAVPIAPGSPDPLHPLPEAWAGKTQASLIAATSVSDAIFCHVKRFIVTAKSREGAIRLAKLACG